MYTAPSDSPASPSKPVLRPVGKPFKSVPDTRSVSVLGLGIVIGAVIGAGVALLTAPQSGRATRKSLGRRVNRVRGEPSGTWARLGRELKRAALVKQKERQLAALKRDEAKAEPVTS